ncbi:class I tRNA ligase family protein, partial [Salinibacterium sp.]|uniref:class I tRNA ligase family protein n=1 Tax=Salinibacterium sp. TaxID=1915057 RepID=UPI00286BE37E
RWFLMSSSVIRGGNLVVTEEGIRAGVRELMLPLWSTYYFFALYANASAHESVRRTDSENLLDRYILAKTGELVRDVTADLEALDSPIAAARLRDFADVLTNWYVRRSRDRFWQGDVDAFDTLFTVLETLTRVAAPLIPLVAEEVWRGLTGGRSVHLTDWPEAGEFPADHELVAEMDYVREVASAGLALRKSRSLRVRLPLAQLTIVTTRSNWFDGVQGILGDELNLKAVDFTPLEEGSLEAFGITRKLTVNARALGPRLGRQVQQVIQAAKAGDWAVRGSDGVTAGSVELFAGEFELELQAADEKSAIAFLGDGGFIVLDTRSTPELEAEGLARDLIRAIQDTRKAAGLDVSDRITMSICGSSESDIAALEQFADTIAAETLSLETGFSVSPDPEMSMLDSAVGSQRATLRVGQYANDGVLVIDVWKSGEVNV